MNSSGKTVVKNIGVLMGSQLVTWALEFLPAIILPHYLGAEGMGHLSIGYSIWAIMSILLMFGMDTHLLKMIARDQSKTAELISITLVLRCVFFVIGMAAVVAYVYLVGYPRETIYVTLILGVANLLLIIGDAYSTGLLAIERMEYMSLATVISKAVTTGLIFLFIFLDLGIYGIAAISSITSLSMLVVQFFYLNRLFPVRLYFNLREAWEMLVASTTYLVGGLAFVVYQEIDIFFISWLADTRAVGWYGTATRLWGSLMFVPAVVTTALFPLLARSYTDSHEQLINVTRRSFNLMFLISIPIGMGIAVVAEPVVLLLFGEEFFQSGTILSILGLVLIFTYLNTLLGQMLISTDRASLWNIVMIVAIFVTLPLDLFLIPLTERAFGNGALGGTISFAITEAGMLATAILLLPRGTLNWNTFRTVALSICAGVVMAAASWWWRDINLFVSILIGALSYLLLVVLLRILPAEDRALLRELALKLIARVRPDNGEPASLGSD